MSVVYFAENDESLQEFGRRRLRLADRGFVQESQETCIEPELGNTPTGVCLYS